MNLTDQQQGNLLRAQGQPPVVCQNLEQIRGWLDRANVEWMRSQQATVTEHQQIADQVQAALKGDAKS